MDDDEPEEIELHGRVINFGKHAGELWTRLPQQYLRWLSNQSNGEAPRIAAAELERRGAGIESEIEISAHAIDRASLRALGVWKRKARAGEGLHAWITRILQEQLDEHEGQQIERIKLHGITFVLAWGERFPTLTTVMRKGD